MLLPDPREPAMTPHAEASDDELAIAWQQGDERAFDAIVRRYGPTLQGFLRRFCGDPDLAEDAYADSMLRVARSPHGYDASGGGSLRAWLYTIARRCGLDAMRSRRRFRALGVKMLAFGLGDRTSAATGESSLIASERGRALDAALATLKEEHRAAILLSYRYDLETKEIGQILGLADQQVRDRIAYARKQLRERLQGELP